MKENARQGCRYDGYRRVAAGMRGDTEWWWTQSGANQSLTIFPYKQGEYRENSTIEDCMAFSMPGTP